MLSSYVRAPSTSRVFLQVISFSLSYGHLWYYFRGYIFSNLVRSEIVCYLRVDGTEGKRDRAGIFSYRQSFAIMIMVTVRYGSLGSSCCNRNG